VRDIHVAREGRDACMSYHNHCSALTAETLDAIDRGLVWRTRPSAASIRPRADAAALFTAGSPKRDPRRPQRGARRFFHKGTNERWRGVFRNDDLTLYEAKVERMLPASCAGWTACGRLDGGNPRLTPD
jgi:hypothetical protein